jgi:hypothetical protein
VQIMYGKSGKIRPVLDNEAHYEARYDNGKAGKPYWNASDVRIGSFQAVSHRSRRTGTCEHVY